MTRAGRFSARLVLAALFVLLSSGCGTGEASDGDAAGSGGSGEVLADAATSCVEAYNLQNLANRDFAFDGTVTKIGDAGSEADDLGYVAVTFEVHEWFRGGVEKRVNVALPAPGQVSSHNDVSYGVRTRLLVSGEPRWGGEPLEHPIGWMCGFTRYHDEGTASQWRTALQR